MLIELIVIPVVFSAQNSHRLEDCLAKMIVDDSTPVGFCLRAAPTTTTPTTTPAADGDAAEANQRRHREDMALKDAIEAQVAAFLRDDRLPDEGQDENEAPDERRELDDSWYTAQTNEQPCHGSGHGCGELWKAYAETWSSFCNSPSAWLSEPQLGFLDAAPNWKPHMHAALGVTVFPSDVYSWQHHGALWYSPDDQPSKGGGKASHQRRGLHDHQLDEDKELLAQLAEFERIDTSFSGRLGACELGLWHVIKHAEIPEDLYEKKKEFFDRLLSKMGRSASYVLVDYAICKSGHEVAQKAFELATVMQKTEMVQTIRGSIKRLTRDRYGCLFLQQVLRATCNLVESSEVPTDLVLAVVTAFRDLLEKESIAMSSNHRHGNFVVQAWVELLQRLPDVTMLHGEQPLCKFRDEVFNNVRKIGVEKIGCRIVLRLLEDENLDEKTLANLTNKLLDPSTLESLMISEGGHYVVQGILEKGSAADKVQVLDHVKGNFQTVINSPGKVFYAQHKYAHHVIQKSFQSQLEPGVRQSQAAVLKLVLKPDGQVRCHYLRLGISPHVVKAMRNCHREIKPSPSAWRKYVEVPIREERRTSAKAGPHAYRR